MFLNSGKGDAAKQTNPVFTSMLNIILTGSEQLHETVYAIPVDEIETFFVNKNNGKFVKKIN